MNEGYLRPWLPHYIYVYAAVGIVQHGVRTFGSAAAVLSVECEGLHRIGTRSGELRSAGEEVESLWTHLCSVCARPLMFHGEFVCKCGVAQDQRGVAPGWEQSQRGKGGRNLELYKVVLMDYYRKSYGSCHESRS
jgi:hypothetical protein